MASILQGTTPSLEIKIASTDFSVTDVVELEFVFQNGGVTIKKGLSDVSVDAVANSFTYTFTEAETLSLTPSAVLYYQLRFEFADGSIVGTKKASLRVDDLISEAVMSE